MQINTQWLLKHRKLILISLTTLSLAVGFFIFKLKIDSSILLVLPENDPVYLSNQAVEDMFGGSEELIILVKSETENGLLDKSGIEAMIKVGDLLKSYSQIDSNKVLSMLDLMFHAQQSSQGKRAPPLDRHIFFSQLSSNQLHVFSEQPAIKGKYISPDKSTTLITASIRQDLANADQPLKIFISSLKKDVSKLNREFPDHTMLLSGQPAIKADLMRYMANDLYRLFPLAILVIMLILYFILGSFRLIWLPILVTFFSIVWAFALKGALGSPLTIVETAIPIILISIACADSIHILLEVIYELGQGHHLKAAIALAINNLKRPIILTTVTTACGFASLITGSGVSIKNMGIYLSIGVVAALFFSLFFLPPLLSFFPEKVLLRSRQGKRSRQSLQKKGYQDPLFKWISSFYNFLYRCRWVGVLFIISLFCLSIIALGNIKTDVDEVRYFKSSTSVRQVAEEIEKKLGGFNTLYLVLRPLAEEGVLDESFLAKCREIKKRIEGLEEVNYQFSFLDWHDSLLEQQGLPLEKNSKEVKESIRQLIKLEESNPKLSKTVNKALTDFNFVIKMKQASTVYLQKVIDVLSPELKQHEDVFEFQFAGDAIRLHNGRLIVQNQMISLLVSVICILLLSSLFFKSWFTGFFITLPTSVAILFNFIVMWVFEVSLNPATAIIASVSLGVGVDYAIHFISRFELERKKGKGQDAILEVISRTAQHTMFPILTNALAVGVGFLVLLFSSYQIIVDMGWIIALSMFITAFSSLVVLPLFLTLYYHFKNKKEFFPSSQK